MDVIEQLKQLAVKVFLGIVPTSADHGSPFKAMLNVKIGNEVKPVLMAGTANGKAEDGHIMAVLNPDPDLVEQVKGGVGYAFVWKEMVGKRCDAAVDVWVDAYKPNPIGGLSKYRSRQFKPAKFIAA